MTEDQQLERMRFDVCPPITIEYFQTILKSSTHPKIL